MKKLLITGAIVLAGVLGYTFRSQAQMFLGGTYCFPSQGCTGTSTKPTYGKVLVGNANGTYDVLATSTLGISSTPGGSNTQIQFNNAGAFGGSANFTFDSATDRIDAVVTNVDLTAATELYLAGSGANIDLKNDDYLAVAGDDISLSATGDVVFDGANFIGDTTDSLYDFGGGGVTYGILNFSGINTSNKTFTFPNSSGTLALGTGTSSQVAFWNNANTLTSSSTFTYDDSIGHLTFSGRNFDLESTDESGNYASVLAANGTAELFADLDIELSASRDILLTSTRDIIFDTNARKYKFMGFDNYGTLDFSGLSSPEKTFYVPNQNGAWALASTSAAGLWQTFTANQNRLGLGTSTPFAKFSIHANNGETNTTLFSIASSTQTATTTFFRVTNRGDIITNAATPTLNSCGTATITSTSTDMRGTISVTAGTPTTCNITYSSRKSDTPTCVASDNNPALAVAINLASTTGVEFGMSAVFSGNIHYICLQ